MHPSLMTAVRRAACAALVLTSGCGLAPSVNILGSFFLVWLIGIVAGQGRARGVEGLQRYHGRADQQAAAALLVASETAWAATFDSYKHGLATSPICAKRSATSHAPGRWTEPLARKY